MKSMTGFGKGVAESSQKKITVEIRSLNSRQLDLNMRVPSIYREKEPEIRAELSRSLERGKVDFTIFFESAVEAEVSVINKPLAAAYHAELRSLAAMLKEPETGLLPMVLKMPDVMKPEKTEPDEDEWISVRRAVDEAIAAFQQFRSDEGETLAKEFRNRIGTIQSLLSEVLKLDETRVPMLKEKIRKNVYEAVGKDKVDQNRFEQELIYYIEKLDITEEKLRLNTHCDYFLKTMDEPSSGRKLGFITQEIGREINTIGSKANDAGIQKMVVQMKDELEKIKEQLLNVL